MNPDQINELLNWMQHQLHYFNQVINESHEKSNYGREAMFEGKRDAYLEMLRRIKSQIQPGLR